MTAAQLIVAFFVAGAVLATWGASADWRKAMGLRDDNQHKDF